MNVLQQNKGLSSVISPKDTAVVFASPERTAQATEYMRSNGYGGTPKMEMWDKNEPGDTGYIHPQPGKNIIEVFDQSLQTNPEALHNAIYGDLQHLMSNRDPNWAAMREEYKANYTPQELERITAKKTWLEDVNGTGGSPNAGHDAYIRHFLNEHDIAMKGQERYGGTMYSPKQLEILDRMKTYLKDGKITATEKKDIAKKIKSLEGK
jgi:hypothetical protein